MKTLHIIFLLAFVILAADAVQAQEQSKSSGKKMPADISITGEIIDTKCFLTGMMGGRGEEHKECAIACIKGGLPPGIVDDQTGNVYILAPEKGTKGGNESLLPYAAKTVTVKGKVVEKGGSKILLYSSVVGTE